MGLGTAVSKSILADIVVQYISKGRLLAKVAPTTKLNGHPPISTFYQPEIEAILLDGLKRFACVKVRFQHTVETFEQKGDGVAGDGQRVVAPAVGSCGRMGVWASDYAHTPIRPHDPTCPRR